MLTPPPFRDDALAAAFPEFQIDLPSLGLGSFKVAYHIVGAEGEAVLKIVKEPATIPVDPGDSALPPRFEREIAAMRRVNSARVVKVLVGPALRDIGGMPHVWYVEPFFAGGTLDAQVGRPISEAEALALTDALLEGVSDLWEQARLVHRDIKPGNIAFGSDGPVLLDLGIALHADLSPLTDAFAYSPRTTRYAAPEQFEVRQNAPIDSRTDQFLVGIVAFEAATGVHPFHPEDPAGYVDRLIRGQVDEGALATLRSDCLRGVLRRLLQPSPHLRFRTAALARRALEVCRS